MLNQRGKFIAARRAGPAPITLAHLSVESPTEALAQADSPGMQERARVAGNQIKPEKGF